MISVKNLNFKYAVEPVLSGLNFTVSTGEWLGILGPNGSGKTTLLKLLSGILKPSSGEIFLKNTNIEQIKSSDLAKIIGVVPQDSNILFPFTVKEIVLMGRTPYQRGLGFEGKEDIAAAETAMEETGIIKFKDRLIQELSGGERQRVIIARALAQEPKIVLLDEPTSFLDIKHQQEICDLLAKLNNEKNLTIISVMHDINMTSLYCKNIMLLKNGEIFKCGPTNEVVTYSNLKKTFETEVYVGINDLSGKPYYMPMKS